MVQVKHIVRVALVLYSAGLLVFESIMNSSKFVG